MRQAGHDVQCWPLLEIAPLADSRALAACFARLSDFQAVMFVSTNAVHFFFAHRPDSCRAFRSGTVDGPRAYVTGPASRAALLHEGVDADLIDAPPTGGGQFDSESLWRTVCAQVGARFRLLVVRGADDDGASSSSSGSGRDWFAQRVHQAGGEVEFLAVYQRRAPVWDAHQQALARQAGADASVWIFTSSQALLNLRHLCPDQSWNEARAIATHPRIGALARELGFGTVCESRPLPADLLASIKSLQ
jgi:uroporphyrinogen-III synthase